MPTKQQIDFVNKYYPAAVEAAKGSKIHPDTIITAAALESGYGKSGLAAKYNNFFGRKPEKSYKGKVVTMQTAEYIKGQRVVIPQPFKHYDTPADGFKDYVRLLSNSKRYAKVLLTSDPKQQFREIQAAGYATAPDYSQKLSSVLDQLKPMLKTATPILLIIGIGALIYFSLKA